MHKPCPVEETIRDGLERAGIDFVRDKELEPGRYSIDFYLPDYGLWVEVCRFHTPRKIKQMSRLTDVVLIQGLDAATQFVSLISRSKGETDHPCTESSGLLGECGRDGLLFEPRDETDNQIFELVKLTNSANEKILRSGSGSMHSMWDVIFDAHAFIMGQRTFLSGTKEDVYNELVRLLREYVERDA